MPGAESVGAKRGRAGVKKLLITGARGLLGSHLVPLLGERWEVVALDRDVADLARPLDAAALPPRIDAVVHLAQSSRFRDFPDGARDLFEVNLARLAQLLDHARRAGAGHFVHASTGSVYARSAAPLTEDMPTAPPDSIGFYPATKLAGELLAQSYAPFMTVGSLRYFFIYGPGQRHDMLVPRLIDSVGSGKPVTLQGHDGLRLNPVHAADAAAATAAALALERSAIVNVAGPETLSIRAMAEAIGERLGVEPRFAAAEGEPGDLVADTARMRALLSVPERRFRDQLDELI